MRRSLQIVVATAALLSASTLASAQRGGGRQLGGGEVRSNGSDVGRMGPPPIPPTVAALVLEHAKDLGITDAQKVTLESIRKTQDSANKPFLARLDSLKPTHMPAGGMGDLSQEQKDEMQQRSIAVQLVLADMKEPNAEARVKVMNLLNEAQQKQAAELEHDAQKRADDEGRRRMESMGGGNRRGAGRPPED